MMRSKFDSQLNELNEKLTEMGETCEEAIGLVAQSLEEQCVERGRTGLSPQCPTPDRRYAPNR